MQVIATPPLSASERIAVPRAARRRFRFIAVIVLASTVSAGGFLLLPPALFLASYRPQEGDIVFQSLPQSPLVNAIEGATGSPYSHCGLVVRERGRWFVYEANGDVHRTPLARWFYSSRNYCFAAYRLDDPHQQHIPKMVEYVRACVGLPYDIQYELDDQKIYCSELVSKAYRHSTGQYLGKLVTLGELDWRPYRQLIEQINRGPVPVDRQMITPRDLAAAEQLRLVTKYGH